MSAANIPTVAIPTLAIAGTSDRFPIRRVFCVGRNYKWQAQGASGEPLREPPIYFMKPGDAVVAAEGSIAYPPLTNDFCHEIELVVAIGRDGAFIAPATALAHVWGYAVGLDLTRRDQQAEAKRLGRPWEGAKAFDASAPCSPLLPVAVAGHPRAGAIWLTVNGVERQRADLTELIWSVEEIISAISHSVGLEAGDLIFTGTPSGVACLESGDVVRGGVDGINDFTVTIGSRPRHRGA